MRLKIHLQSDRIIFLEVGYIHRMQGLIYNLFDKHSKEWLHNSGFRYEKRKFKLFTFSWLYPKPIFDKKRRGFIFPREVNFLIASPVDWILEEIAQNFIKNDDVYIGKNVLILKSVEVLIREHIEEKMKIKMITPIYIKRTADSGEVIRITPFDEDFVFIINENLQRKWEALYNKSCPYSLKILPDFTRYEESKYKNIVTYKSQNPRIVLEAWKGIYNVEGDRDLISFAYDVGLGSRNSQGFGMFDFL